MSEPLVSVIVPNYNHAPFLRKRLESVFSQSYKNFEVIILDDCSVDNSQLILEEYRYNPKVIYFGLNSQPSGSTFRQWKEGLSHANGEWIWFAETDDFADHSFLTEMIGAVANKPNVGIVYCDSLIVDSETSTNEPLSEFKNKRLNTDKWTRSHEAAGRDELMDFLLKYGSVGNASAMLFKTRLFLEVNPFDKDFRLIGDKYAIAKMLNVADLAYLHKQLNYYRNPFNTKHSKEGPTYYYEQFLIFDWVLHHVSGIDLKKFYAAFHAVTSFSLIRDWSVDRVRIFWDLFRLNPGLLLKSVTWNVLRSFRLHRQAPLL